MSQVSIEQATLEKTVAEMVKLNEETRKFVAEAHKLDADAKLSSKKEKWFEFTMLLGLVAASVAATKIFL